MAADAGELRARILALVAEYHDAAFPQRAFVPGETPVPEVAAPPPTPPEVKAPPPEQPR